MIGRNNSIMQFVWIFVFVMAVAAAFIAFFRGEISDTIIFAIISVISAGMYFLRKNMRNNS